MMKQHPHQPNGQHKAPERSRQLVISILALAATFGGIIVAIAYAIIVYLTTR